MIIFAMLYVPLILTLILNLIFSYRFLRGFCSLITYHIYFHCLQDGCAGAERITAIKQNPTWVTIPQLTLIIPINVYFQVSVSNIGTERNF